MAAAESLKCFRCNLPKKTKQVPILKDVTAELFQKELYPKRRPVVLRGFDIGDCVEKWTTEYLIANAGNKQVNVHVSSTHQMDFINKNFLYRTLPFGELVKRASKEINEDYFISPDEKYYLRSLGDDPRKSVADVRQQFPHLMKDLNIPPLFPAENFFSSVFRIASKSCQLWTHYDVMDNILMQIRGHKKVVLFSPQDAHFLYLKGDKSEVLDIDDVNTQNFPLFTNATRYECLLEPGDIIFIPALWFHNVISEEFGVAVNVFWKHLDSSLYCQKDPYGNKDPVAVISAFQIVDRAVKALECLPKEYQDFYGRMLVSRIEKKCYLKDLEENEFTNKDDCCES
ncbi:TYW5 [Acanthosepion pharaonis]|uniref:tRNA wybutosine-synthesizing protein 4 n=1 Tax=Acanthosepion pharaonis TaxID=158019 RepID=A0A812C5Q8_ACAPH|nr:TYW5 [Sepia pharaonis]